MSRSTGTPCNTCVTPTSTRSATQDRHPASRPAPTSRQVPVVSEYLAATRRGGRAVASFDGCASCPLTTGRNKMLLAAFDYDMERAPSTPFIDKTKERRDMWLPKRYGLPAMYWNLMLKGRA